VRKDIHHVGREGDLSWHLSVTWGALLESILFPTHLLSQYEGFFTISFSHVEIMKILMVWLFTLMQ
jgi:membrane associated rhomboid family serine protease